MSFQITDASTASAIQTRFSCHHNHSVCQEDQLELVRRYGIMLGPWLSEAADASVFATQSKEEALNYMAGRLPGTRGSIGHKQIRHFVEMPVGSVGIIKSSEGLKKGSHALVVRITSDYAAGPAPGLRALRNAEGKHCRIALEEKLPAGELFHCLYRNVEIVGELTDEAVRSAFPLCPKAWTTKIATPKSFDTARPLWLSAPEALAPVAAAAAEPEAVAAPAPLDPIAQAEQQIREREERLRILAERLAAIKVAEKNLLNLLSI
jgi:hypothetical protein